MTGEGERLRIIAEPKAIYRERYESEHGTNGNRIKRYIRAEGTNQCQLEYPTIEVGSFTLTLQEGLLCFSLLLRYQAPGTTPSIVSIFGSFL